MILFKLLSMDNFYNVSKNIDIAKGKYKAVGTIEDAKKQLKRIYHGR